jgi:hypothetical protein
MQIKIDPEFKALAPPLSTEERQGLERSIVEAGGARDPLVTWKGVLLDGHNRHEICTEHGLAFDTVEAGGVKTRQDARVWIVKNQLARRNVTLFGRAELAYRALNPNGEAKRAKAGRPGKNRANSHNYGCREIAALAGIREETANRCLSLIEEFSSEPGVLDSLRSGVLSINKAYTGREELSATVEGVRVELADAEQRAVDAESVAGRVDALESEITEARGFARDAKKLHDRFDSEVSKAVKRYIAELKSEAKADRQARADAEKGEEQQRKDGNAKAVRERSARWDKVMRELDMVTSGLADFGLANCAKSLTDGRLRVAAGSVENTLGFLRDLLKELKDEQERRKTESA